MKVTVDRAGNTLKVWFDDPKKEFVSDETTEEIVLVKDKAGNVIGFEVLNDLSAREPKTIEKLLVGARILS